MLYLNRRLVGFAARIVRTLMGMHVDDATHEGSRGVILVLARLMLFIVWSIATIM